MQRRAFLGLATAVGVGSLAGCQRSDTETTGGETESTAGETTARTRTDSSQFSVSGSYRQSQYDAAGTGYRDRAGPAHGETHWSFRTAETGPSYSIGSPVVADGTVYVAEGGKDGDEFWSHLYALDAATGTEQWASDLGEGNVSAEPAVVDGTVYQPAGRVSAFDAETGQRQWESSADVETGVTVADGTVYWMGFSRDGMAVYAIDADTGRTRWTAPVTTDRRTIGPSKPAVADGTVYVGHGDLSAFDAADGSRKWSRSYDESITSSPTVRDGRLYLGGIGGTVRAVSATDGTPHWVTTVESGATDELVNAIGNSVAVSPEYILVMNSWQLTALAVETGQTHWTRSVRASSHPVVAGDTALVSGISTLEAYDIHSGDRRFRVSTDSQSGASKIAVADGVVYFPSAGLHAVV